MRSPGPAVASLLRKYRSEVGDTLQPVLPRPIIQTGERPKKGLSAAQEHLKKLNSVHVCFPSTGSQ